MHLLRIPEGFTEEIPVAYGCNLRAGEIYLATNAFTGSMLQTRWRIMIKDEMWALNLLLQASPYHNKPFDPALDWNNHDIWLIRGGGYGDLLALTPLIRELTARWPRAMVRVACGRQYHGIFDGMPGVTQELLPLPFKAINNSLSTVISLEETVEGTPGATQFHISQLFANHCGIILKDLKPSYYPKHGEMFGALEQFAITPGKPRIAIQVLASGLYRSYPKIQYVIKKLAERDVEVFLLGVPGQMQLKEEIPNVVNLMEEGLNFRESAAVLMTCNAAIAPDSALVHLCSALGVPCVALYGPFPASLRVSSDKVAPIEGKAPCAPCFYHAAHSTDFPAGMPCATKGRCLAMEDIDPDLVVETALRLAVDKEPVSTVLSHKQ